MAQITPVPVSTAFPDSSTASNISSPWLRWFQTLATNVPTSNGTQSVINSPLLVNAAVGGPPGVVVKGSDNPLQLWSPDGSRHFQIGIGNTTDPQLYSSTNIIGVSSSLSIDGTNSSSPGIIVKGTASPLRFYSPDNSNYFMIGLGNSPNNFPNLYSNLGGIRVSIGTNQWQVSGGYGCHAGTSASAFGNAFNFFWTGSLLQAWIDGTNLGNVTICDARVKRDIEPLPPALETINQLRPVAYGYQTIEGDIWQDDGKRHAGFLGHEAQEIEAKLVNGGKDELTPDGRIQPQTLNLLDLCAMLTKAVQELSARLEALEKRA